MQVSGKELGGYCLSSLFSRMPHPRRTCRLSLPSRRNVTERKAIDIIRSRSKLVDMEFWESTYGIEIPLPGDHGLADAMARLPAAYRDILLLRYYNGYSVREISSMLHIKKDTAQKQLWRAKAALQKHLKGDA